MNNKPHHSADPNAIIKTYDGAKNVYTFNPRAFNIVWGSDNRYWKIPRPNPTSSSTKQNENKTEDEVAELIQVSWLEVTGSVEELKPLKTYQITFALSFKRDAFGWTGSPVFMMAKVGKKGKYKWKRLKELESLPRDETDVPSNEDSFTVESGQQQPDMRLYFGLYEVWSGKWKGGLRVHKAIVKEI